MTVGYDTQATATPTATGTTLVWSHTLAAGATDLIVVVGDANPNGDTTSCKVGTTPMTQLAKLPSDNTDAFGTLIVYGLTSPPTGAQTITFTTGTTLIETSVAGSMSFTGSHGVGSIATAFGSSVTASATISATTAGNMCVAGMATGTGITSSANTSRFISNGDATSGVGNCAGATAASTGSAVTMSWSITSDAWAAAAFEVLAAAGGAVVLPDLAMPPMRGSY